MLVVTFKSTYISWEICKSDELDLTRCQFETIIRHNPPLKEEESPEPRQEKSTLTTENYVEITSIDIVDELEADINDNDTMAGDHMPDAIYIKNVSLYSIDASSAASSASSRPTSHSTSS